MSLIESRLQSARGIGAGNEGPDGESGNRREAYRVDFVGRWAGGTLRSRKRRAAKRQDSCPQRLHFFALGGAAGRASIWICFIFSGSLGRSAVPAGYAFSLKM